MADEPNPAGTGGAASTPAAATQPAPAGPDPAAAASPPAAVEAAPAPVTADPGAAAKPPAAEPATKAAEAVAAVEPKATEFPPTAMDGGLTAKPAEPAKVVDAAKPAEKPKETEAAKPAEAAKTPDPSTVVDQPIDYAFAFPDDIKPDQVNQERLTELRTALQGEKVKPEVAQKLLDLHLAELREITPKITQRLQEQSWDNFRTTTNGWLTELKSDEVVGGARFDTAMRTIATVIEQYLPPDKQSALRDRLRATGMGNDVNLALLLHTFGAMMGREAPMIPAHEPRQRPLNRQERGMARYNGTAAPQR